MSRHSWPRLAAVALAAASQGGDPASAATLPPPAPSIYVVGYPCQVYYSPVTTGGSAGFVGLTLGSTKGCTSAVALVHFHSAGSTLTVDPRYVYDAAQLVALYDALLLAQDREVQLGVTAQVGTSNLTQGFAAFVF